LGWKIIFDEPHIICPVHGLQQNVIEIVLVPITKTGRAGVTERNKIVSVTDERGYAGEFVAQIRRHALIGMVIVHIHPLEGRLQEWAYATIDYQAIFP
jgi:hypothetical protein